MVSSEAVARILWHAGLPFPSSGSELPKGSMSTAAVALVGIEEACEDLLRALERLNVELNGPVPSEITALEKRNELPRQLVWSVERILRQMEEAWEDSNGDEQGQLMISSIEKVKFWWRCVLDGDVDKIGTDWEVYLQTR